MLDLFRGLPVHALVVHGVVVLVPLASLGLIAIAVRPSWRHAYSPVVALLATAGLVMVPVAVASGNNLRARLHAGGVVARQISAHQAQGYRVLLLAALLWLASVALLVLTRRGVRGRAVTVVAVLSVVVALAATAQVAYAGHLGSTAVWGCTINAGACK